MSGWNISVYNSFDIIKEKCKAKLKQTKNIRVPEEF